MWTVSFNLLFALFTFVASPTGSEQQQPTVSEVSDPGGRGPVRVQSHRSADRRRRDRGHAHGQRSE